MKFVVYNDNQPGILTDAGVIDIGDLCPGGGQTAIVHLVTNYDDLKSQLETRAAEGSPVAGAQLQSPLPRPSKVLCMGGNYREFGAREPSPMWGFTKNTHSILGPGEPFRGATSTSRSRVYPRPRGGTNSRAAEEHDGWGLSPPTRGNLSTL